VSSSPGLPRDWIPTLVRLLEREPNVARVVVTDARGSTPREPGAFMLVGQDGVEGSIGGGRLEFEAIAAARALLTDPSVSARVTKVVLAADVGQCCGGVVSFWLDKFTRDDVSMLRAAGDAGARGAAALVSEVTALGIRRRVVRGQESRGVLGSGSAGMQPPLLEATSAAAPGDLTAAADRLLREPRLRAQPIVLAVANSVAVPTATAATATVADATAELTFIERLDDNLPAVWLYGAGHVGQALARILAELPLRLTWIDSRAELFPATLPEGVRVLQDADSVATVFEAPVGAYFVVMSHSHPLDFELCHALLERNDFAWLGLIGSDSKAARFRSRLTRTGLSADLIAKLVCPIGVEGITSKWPAAIAVAVAAQLMQKVSAAERSEILAPVALLPMALQPVALSPEAPYPVALSPEVAHPMALPLGGAASTGPELPWLPRATSATPEPLGAPCAPELCSTCGSTTENSSNTTPSPRPDTVPS
jgi:xanthine dehydrogenase accessory factor